MRAFHNDRSIKEAYLRRLREHRAADELIHGKYWENGRGCAVGCTIQSSDHAAYENELGIPRGLAWLEDCIFENLPNAKSIEWPEAFLASIPVGADLSQISDQFMIWLLMDEEAGLIRFTSEQGQPAIKYITALYQRRLAGKKITDSEWLDALSLVGDVTYADATYAASDAAVNATYHAIVYDTGAGVANAVQSAAAAVASISGKSPHAHFIRISEKLLELLASAPIPAEL